MEPNISNGNHNNFHWKNKLEDVSNLPDATLADKNATWEKLHNRLHQKTGRLKPIWYWIAAATLLFAIMIPVMVYDRKQNTIVKNNTEKVPSKKETNANVLSSEENTVVDVPTAGNERKHNQASLKINEKSSATSKIVLKEESGLYSPLNDESGIIKDPIILPTDADSSWLNTVAAAPVKKRLKVVHINELGNPLTETPNIALQYEQHSFRLKLLNTRAYTGTSLPSVSRGFTIFKTIKASSN